VLAGVNLSEAKGLDSTRLRRPSIVGVDTLLRIERKIPESFLGSALADRPGTIQRVQRHRACSSNRRTTRRTACTSSCICVHGVSSYWTASSTEHPRDHSTPGTPSRRCQLVDRRARRA
jgi:hypothetical protein